MLHVGVVLYSLNNIAFDHNQAMCVNKHCVVVVLALVNWETPKIKCHKAGHRHFQLLALLHNIVDRLIMSFYWYSDNVRSYIWSRVLVNKATNSTLNVAPNCGLVLSGYDKVGQEICL